MGTTDDQPVYLPTQEVLRHLIVMGSSGSGKTVECKSVLEQLVINGIPVIAIDPQGDIASIGHPNSSDVLSAKGTIAVAADFYSKMDLKVWTPGSERGLPLSLTPRFPGAIEPWEDQVKAWNMASMSLASIAGYKSDSKEVIAAFSAVQEYAYAMDLALESVDDFTAFLADPPTRLREALDPIFGKKSREEAVRRLMSAMAGPERLMYELGIPIDIPTLLGYEKGGARDQGMVRVSVIYLNTLGSSAEKENFIAVLCNALYAWMLRNPSPTPQGVLYIDEVAPYVPPVRKPVCKASLSTLLRQARKYGVGILLATQSPGDVDYNALGQIGTWLLGRLVMRQQMDKVMPFLSAAGRGMDMEDILDGLPAMEKGKFIMVCPEAYEQPVQIKTRWLVSQHMTLDAEDLGSLVSDRDRKIYGGEKE